MSQLKIGFVGAGMMAQAVHLPNFLSLPDCEIVALAETRPQLGERVARRFGIPRVVESHLAFAEDPDIEAVVAITQEFLHAQIAIDLLQAGKHVYTEKPIAGCVSDGEAVLRAAEESGKQMMVGYMKRHDPGVEAAKGLIDSLQESGEYGSVRYVRAHCMGGDWIARPLEVMGTDEPYPPMETRLPAWLSDDQAQIFNHIRNVYCHNVNLLRHLLGEILSVEAVELRFPTQHFTFQFDGFRAHLETGHVAHGDWDEGLTIYFQKGQVEIRTFAPLLTQSPARVTTLDSSGTRTLRVKREWAFWRAAQHFVECCLTGQPPRSGAADALQDLHIIEQMFRTS